MHSLSLSLSKTHGHMQARAHVHLRECPMTNVTFVGMRQIKTEN